MLPPKKLKQKQIKFCLKLAKFVQFLQNIGNIGIFHPIPNHKTMQTMCLGVFFWYFVHFGPSLAGSIWCPVGGSVGGCGARAISSNTPIYFIDIWFSFLGPRGPLVLPSVGSSVRPFVRSSRAKNLDHLYTGIYAL